MVDFDLAVALSTLQSFNYKRQTIVNESLWECLFLCWHHIHFTSAGVDCRLSLTCLYDYQMAKMSMSCTFYCPQGDFHLVLLFLVIDPGIYCQKPLGKSVIPIATMLNLL